MNTIADTADKSNEIRIATPDDFQEMFRVCCMLHKENGQHDFSETKVRHFLWRGCNRDQAIVGVIGPSDDIKAMVFLDVMPVYYSDDVQLLEQFLFVRPDSRRTDYAKRLILFAKHAADQLGCDLTIAIISNEKLAAKERLYARHLPRSGAFYIYRPGQREQVETA